VRQRDARFGTLPLVLWIARAVALACAVVLFASGVNPVVPAVLLVGLVITTVASETRRTRAASEPKNTYARTYSAPADQTYVALEQAINRLGYRITGGGRDARAVQFNTGTSLWSWSGQDYAASVRPTDDNSSDIVIAGSTSPVGLGAMQMFAWGETGRLARKVLDGVQASL
jgi:hypothetical protein